MCNKLSYCNPRVDICLVDIIRKINKSNNLRTLASCCGHSKYIKTIVVKDITTNRIFEYFSKIELKFKKRNRYYKRDNEGFYYILEILFRLGYYYFYYE
jgi:tRNA(Phe) wybutosine-synthesizing methylase Tyw3